jgi:hypothetical protein
MNGRDESIRRAVKGLAALGLLAAAMLLSGCGDMIGNTNAEVTGSIPFDKVSCTALIAQRNALVARYGSPAALPADHAIGMRPYLRQQPMGVLVPPEFRSEDTLAKRKALGRIDAMNHSIDRRQCGVAHPRQNGGILGG